MRKKNITLKELKKYQEAKKGKIIEYYINRKVSILITKLLIKTSITPNQVTWLSLLAALIAAFFFFKADYTSIIIGGILYELSHVLDCVDGEIARIKNMCSEFGNFLDGMTDRIGVFAVFSSIAVGLYLQTYNPLTLVLGMLSVGNLLMIINTVDLFNLYVPSKKFIHEFAFKNIYIGGIDTAIFMVFIFAVFNQLYYLLLFWAAIGTLVWIKQFYSRYRLCYKK